jgi:hypothetical protein
VGRLFQANVWSGGQRSSAGAWDDGDELRRRAWCFAPKRSDAARVVLRAKLREVQRELELLHKRERKLVDELTTFYIAPITTTKTVTAHSVGELFAGPRCSCMRRSYEAIHRIKVQYLAGGSSGAVQAEGLGAVVGVIYGAQ